MGVDNNSQNPENSPDNLQRNEPLKLPPITSAQRLVIRVVARVCLALAPLLRRWFPQRWQQIASFHLHNLVFHEQEDLAFRYLECGADPNGICPAIDCDLGTPPLNSASVYGSVRIVELLLRAGADVNGSNNYGTTALMVAAEFGHTDVVALLLDSGARINDAEKLIGHTALFKAAASGYLPTVRLLAARGADTGYRVRQRLRAADWARLVGGKAQNACADYLEGLSEAA